MASDYSKIVCAGILAYGLVNTEKNKDCIQDTFLQAVTVLNSLSSKALNVEWW